MGLDRWILCCTRLLFLSIESARMIIDGIGSVQLYRNCILEIGYEDEGMR